MATVIDSLIIELGLDPTQFDKGQKAAGAAFLKTRDQAVSAGKQIEEASKKTADAINKAKVEALGFFAVLLGARGLKEFVADVTASNAALGRFSANLAESPQTVSAWGMAAERMGGSAEATGASFERVGKALYDLRRNGQMLPKEFSQLQAATGRFIDTNNGVDKFLESTAGALKALAAIDPARAHFLAQGMGIDDATANVMIKYGDAIGAYIGQLKKLAPSNEAIKGAQDLQDAWNGLTQSATSLGNAIQANLDPILGPLLRNMATWIDHNKTLISDDVAGWAKKIADDLPAIVKGAEDFADNANDAADAVGGWVNIGETLILLWTGAKFAELLANIARAAALIRSVGVVGSAGAVAGAAGVGGVFKLATNPYVAGAIAAYEAFKPKTTNEGEDAALAKQKASAAAQGFQPGWIMGADGRYRPPNAAEKAMQDKVSGNTVDGRPVSKSNPMPVMPVGDDDPVSSGADSGLPGGGGGGNGGAGGPVSDGNVRASGNSAGVKGWWTAERQAHAFKALTEGGLISPAAAKGLISRWVNVESSGGPSSQNNIGGGHYGIAQWSHARAGSLFGNPDFDAQLALVRKEASNSAYAARLHNAKTDEEGATAASNFERADGYNPRTGTDNYTNRTLGGMRGLDAIIAKGGGPGSVMTGASPFGALDRRSFGAPSAAALSTIQNSSQVTTSQSSNEMHVGTINVNAPNATDANGIAGSITPALQRSTTAATANYGPR